MWTPITKLKPNHCEPVLLWIVGGSLHFNEDFADVGIYHTGEDKFLIYNDGDDVEVKVSHWQRIYPPNKESRNAAKENRVKLASLPPLNPNPEEAFTARNEEAAEALALRRMDTDEGRNKSIAPAKLRKRSGPISYKGSERAKRSRSQGSDGVRDDIPQTD